MENFDFVIHPIGYLGVYILFAAIFAGFGMLCARKVKWQYALTKIFAVIISAALSVLILQAVTPMMGSYVMRIIMLLFPGEEFMDLLKNEMMVELIGGIIGVVFAFVLYLPIFIIVKAILNLISRCIYNAVLKSDDDSNSIGQADFAVSDNTDVNACEGDIDAENTDGADIEDSGNCEEVAVMSEASGDVNFNTESTEQVEKPQKEKKKKKIKPVFTTKVCGLSLLFGAISGFLVYNAVISPMVMLISDIGSIAGPILKENELDCLYENVESISDNAATSTVSVLGGRMIYDGLTSLKVSGEKVVLSREVKFTGDILNIALKASSDECTSEELAEYISMAEESFKKTTLIPIAASSIAKEASASWLRGNEYIGISRPVFDEDNVSEEELIDVVLEELSEATVESIREDIVTVIDMVKEATDGGLFDIIGNGGSSSAYLEFFTDKEVIYNILYTAFKNDRMAVVFPYAADVGIGFMADTLSIPKDYSEIYDDLLTALWCDFDVAFTDSEGISQFICSYAKLVKADYDEAGISLLCGEEYIIAACITSESSNGNISLETIAKVIADKGERFIDVADISNEEAFTSWLAGLGISHEDAVIIAGEFPFEKSNNGLTAKDFAVSGAKDLESKSFRVVFADVKAKKGLPSDRSLAAASMADVIEAAAKIIFASDNTSGGSVDALLNSLGGALDSLSSCEYFSGEVMDDLVVAMLQSNTFRGAFKITAGKATEISSKLNNGVASGGSYTQHLVAISKAINVVASDGGKPSTDDVKDMIGAVTPETSEVLKEIVSSEVLEGNGIPKDKSESISGMMGSMIDEMAKVNASDADPEYIEKESNAVSKVIEIATSSNEDYSEGIFSGEGTTEEKIDEYVDLVADSDIVSNTLIEVVYGEGESSPKKDPLGLEKSLGGSDGAYFVSKLDAKYKQAIAGGMSGDELTEYEKVIYSMAAVMNVDIVITGGNVIQK